MFGSEPPSGTGWGSAEQLPAATCCFSSCLARCKCNVGVLRPGRLSWNASPFEINAAGNLGPRAGFMRARAVTMLPSVPSASTVVMSGAVDSRGLVYVRQGLD